MQINLLWNRCISAFHLKGGTSCEYCRGLLIFCYIMRSLLLGIGLVLALGLVYHDKIHDKMPVYSKHFILRQLDWWRVILYTVFQKNTTLFYGHNFCEY